MNVRAFLLLHALSSGGIFYFFIIFCKLDSFGIYKIKLIGPRGQYNNPSSVSDVVIQVVDDGGSPVTHHREMGSKFSGMI